MANQKINNLTHFMMVSGEFHDEQQAMDILKASLQALRDRLPKVEAFHLGTILPESLRHSYFAGWHNGQRQAESVNKSEFMAEVADHLNGYEDHDLTDLVPVVLEAILNLVSDTEAEKVKEAIPRSMQNIFTSGQSMD